MNKCASEKFALRVHFSVGMSVLMPFVLCYVLCVNGVCVWGSVHVCERFACVCV